MSGARNGKHDPFKKRIPENPRYKHIKAVVDSGASVTKYLEHLEEIRKNYKFKKDEIFRRIKPTTFAQLILQVASVTKNEQPLQNIEEEQSFNLDTSYSPPSTARSTLLDLVSGVGELDISSSDLSPSRTLTPSSCDSTPEKVSEEECPYLLLDVREVDNYRKCHIVTAKSYPSVMLSRSCNPFTREILHYKNRPGCIIILYDENETIAPEVATKMVERDFDNVFMLSGGMKVLYKTFPECFMTGELPLSCYPTPPSTKKSSRLSAGGKQKILFDSVCGSLKDSFTVEDLLVIQRRLDEVLLNASSSRGTSRCSTTSKLSTSTKSSIKPWK